MEERAVPALGKLTVILDGTSSIQFEDVSEDYYTNLQRLYRRRRPFFISGIVEGQRRRLLQFPKSPPKGLAWDENRK